MIDPASFASQLVAAERAGIDQQHARLRNNAQVKLDAFKSLKTHASSLADKLQALQKDKQLSATKATAGDDSIFKATSTEKAVPGSYQIEVSQLAQAHQIGLSFTDENWQPPTTGNLTLDVGGDTMTLDLSTLPPDGNLADLRDAINNADDNPGIQATIIRTGSDVKLVISSEESGAANTLNLSLSGGAGSQYDELNTALAGQTELTAAQDAQLTFAGIAITSSSNKIDNLTDGLTLELTKTNIGSPTTLTIEQDNEVIFEVMDELVTAYNTLIEQAAQYSISKDGERAALSGDGTARSLTSQLRSVFNNLPAGTYLSDIGLEFDRNGKLSLNKTDLEASLSNNSQVLNTVLLDAGAVVDKLTAVIEPYTEVKGFFANRISSLEGQIDRVDDKSEQLDLRMQHTYQRYLAQFTQMNAVQAQMQQTSSLFSSAPMF